MQTYLLSNVAKGRQNNFNLIRAIAAAMVIITHSYTVMGYQKQPLNEYRMDLGYISVDVFFLTSGFLVTASLLTRRDLWVFLWARLLRIIPGLFGALLFCVMVVGPMFTTLPLATYFSSTETFQFLGYNSVPILKLAYNLPGVFESNPLPDEVNKSLWSLPWEMRSYLVLLLLGVGAEFVRRFNYDRIVKIAVTGLAIVFMSLHLFDYYIKYPFLYSTMHLLSTTMFRLMSLFFVGGVFYCYRDKVVMSGKVAGIMAGVLLLASLSTAYFFIPYKLFLGYLVLYLAYMKTPVLWKFNSLPDYSYGLYIYSFPIQQSLVTLFPSIDLLTMFAVSFSLSLVMASFSWHLIEKPALNLKRHLVQARPRLLSRLPPTI